MGWGEELLALGPHGADGLEGAHAAVGVRVGVEGLGGRAVEEGQQPPLDLAGVVGAGVLAHAGEAAVHDPGRVDELHLDRVAEGGQLRVAQGGQVVDGQLERALGLLLGRRVAGGLVVEQDDAVVRAPVDPVDAAPDQVVPDLHLEPDLEPQRPAGGLGLAAVPQLEHAHAVAPVLVGDGPRREPGGVEPLAVGGLQVVRLVGDVALGGQLEDGVHEPAEGHLVGGAVVEPGHAAEEVPQVAVLVGPDPRVGGAQAALGGDRLGVDGVVAPPPPGRRVDTRDGGQGGRGGQSFGGRPVPVARDPAQGAGGLQRSRAGRRRPAGGSAASSSPSSRRKRDGSPRPSTREAVKTTRSRARLAARVKRRRSASRRASARATGPGSPSSRQASNSPCGSGGRSGSAPSRHPATITRSNSWPLAALTDRTATASFLVIAGGSQGSLAKSARSTTSR